MNPKAAEKPKNKGGRPKKPEPEMHAGRAAAKRFEAGLKFAIAGGPEQRSEGKGRTKG